MRRFRAARHIAITKAQNGTFCSLGVKGHIPFRELRHHPDQWRSLGYVLSVFSDRQERVLLFQVREAGLTELRCAFPPSAVIDDVPIATANAIVNAETGYCMVHHFSFGGIDAA